MLQTKEQKAQVGVIVGRFQVPMLHEGHHELIRSVIENHDRVIIVLGLSYSKCTFNNPYDYECRKNMFHETYPDLTIIYIKDCQEDEIWSKNLDTLIEDHVPPDTTICMYGSRDSFIKAYFGKYPTVELVQSTFVSGTEVRKKLAQKVVKDERFRIGINWAVGNQYPGPFMTIDVAIFNEDNTRILLGRKKDEIGYRLIGGFVQNGEKLSQAVIREAKEETGLTIGDLQYIDSFPSNDYRYRGERDKILTVLHTAKIIDGKPEPNDDIHELKWFDFNDSMVHAVISNHKEMIQELLGRICQQSS